MDRYLDRATKVARGNPRRGARENPWQTLHKIRFG